MQFVIYDFRQCFTNPKLNYTNDFSMKKTTLFVFMLCFSSSVLVAQDRERIMAEKMKMEKEAATLITKLEVVTAEIAAAEAILNPSHPWQKKFFGTLGGNVAQFNNWYSAPNSFSQSSNILAALNGFVNYTTDKIIWKNNALLNLGVQRVIEDVRVDNDSIEWQKIPDQFQFSSLVGYRITKAMAASVETAYRTPILSGINNPGDLDLGIGVTWTPVSEFFFLVHPLNYHWKFGDNPEYNNALGARIKARYSNEIMNGLSWVSNLEGFYSYQEFDPNAHWWEWTNGLSFSVWKGIGVGVNLAFRAADAEIVDEVQFRWNIGISYTL